MSVSVSVCSAQVVYDASFCSLQKHVRAAVRAQVVAGTRICAHEETHQGNIRVNTKPL